MKKKKIIWAIALFILVAPVYFIYLTFSNSVDCSQLVIDTYELHSGINIPKVEFVNCYYDENSKIRIAVYDLKSNIEIRNFEFSNFTTQTLHGISLLEETERPDKTQLYLATGEKWGNKWTYVVDNDSQRLWAELKYEN